MPDVPRLLDDLDVDGSGKRLAVVPLLVATRPRLRVDLKPRVPRDAEGLSLCAVSSSSRRRRASSRLCSSSAALRSAARCRSMASASCSARSSVTPFHDG